MESEIVLYTRVYGARTYPTEFRIDKWAMWVLMHELVRRVSMIQQTDSKTEWHRLWQWPAIDAVRRSNFANRRQESTKTTRLIWPIRLAMQYLQQPIFHQSMHQIYMEMKNKN